MQRVVRNWLIRFVFLVLAWKAVLPCPAQSTQYSHVKSDTIEERLRQYKGGDSKRQVTLAGLFEEVGCNGEQLELQPVKDADAPNVICTLPGNTDKVIVIGAHFDRADRGDGVADNWSGASLLPSLYQSLSVIKRKHTFVFIGFSDEEEGLVGSRFYVQGLSEKELDSIESMINLDTLGLDNTKVWAGNGDPFLVSLVFRIASIMKLPLDLFNVDGYGFSDEHSFKARGVRTLMLHSISPDTIGMIHSEKDRFSAIDLDDYYDSYNLIAAYLTSLDAQEP